MTLLNKTHIGFKAESYVQIALQREGWFLLARNFRCIGSEIDLILFKEQNIRVVEVKFRKFFYPDMTNTMQLLPKKKLRSLTKGIQTYLSLHPITFDTIRMDLAVVTMEATAPFSPRILIYENIHHV
jgi:Holliday junction resolvase-like predicted endonuclease